MSIALVATSHIVAHGRCFSRFKIRKAISGAAGTHPQKVEIAD